MSVARATLEFPASVHEAETCWYDTSRWRAWVDGLEEIVDVDGDWPQVGAKVTWRSGPAGRGHVTERVVAFEPLGGQTVEVSDDSINGRQSVSFTPVDGTVAVELTLDYEIQQRSIVTPVLDALFIRRAMTSSLRATLMRFGVELARGRHAQTA